MGNRGTLSRWWMALPAGLIKSQKGTSQAIRRVKQGAKSSHPLCQSTLTLTRPFFFFFFKAACQNNIFLSENLCCEALTYRLIPIQAESAWFWGYTSDLIQTTYPCRGLEWLKLHDIPSWLGIPVSYGEFGTQFNLPANLASAADNGKHPVSVSDHPPEPSSLVLNKCTMRSRLRLDFILNV